MLLPPLRLPCGRIIRPIMLPQLWSAAYSSDEDDNTNPLPVHELQNGDSSCQTFSEDSNVFTTKRDKIIFKKVEEKDVILSKNPPSDNLNIIRKNKDENESVNSSNSDIDTSQEKTSMSILLGNVNTNPHSHDLLKDIVQKRKIGCYFFTEPNVTKANLSKIKTENNGIKKKKPPSSG